MVFSLREKPRQSQAQKRKPFTMAQARSLSIFLVAVLAASCLAEAYSSIPGTIMGKTPLQAQPGAGTSAHVVAPLFPKMVVTVMCRTQSDVVFNDPWWLKVTVPSTGMSGWAADFFVNCGVVGSCTNVGQC